MVADLAPGGQEPGDVLAPGSMHRLAGEEIPPAEHRVAAPQRDHPRNKPEHRLVEMLPVDPRDLVVLAVGVVVAALRATDLVATAQHRAALRGQAGGGEIAALPCTQLEDRRVVGRAFDAAIP